MQCFVVGAAFVRRMNEGIFGVCVCPCVQVEKFPIVQQHDASPYRGIHFHSDDESSTNTHYIAFIVTVNSSIRAKICRIRANERCLDTKACMLGNTTCHSALCAYHSSIIHTKNNLNFHAQAIFASDYIS